MKRVSSTGPQENSNERFVASRSREGSQGLFSKGKLSMIDVESEKEDMDLEEELGKRGSLGRIFQSILFTIRVSRRVSSAG